MTETKATPRPWLVDATFPTAVWRGDMRIASTDVQQSGNFAEFEANARLIVQAVNSHQALVNALKYAREIIADQAERFHKECRCQLCEGLPMVIDSALAVAKEEEGL